MSMEPILVTRTQLEEIKRLQIRARADWPATFSVNCHVEIWPWTNWGLTPEHNRLHIQGVSPAVDAIAKLFLEIRGEGGRFFVDATGAFYVDDFDGRIRQFVNFRHCL
jgi:hypothetical protein